MKSQIIKLIEHWSKTFNLPVNTEKKLLDYDKASFATSLIKEETQELVEAQLAGDLTEIQDALGDLLWVTVRAMQEYGINPDKTIEKIYKSNMSKLDYSNTDALTTKAVYTSKGIDTYVVEKNNTFVTRRVSDGKVLKSYLFQPPKFD